MEKIFLSELVVAVNGELLPVKRKAVQEASRDGEGLPHGLSDDSAAGLPDGLSGEASAGLSDDLPDLDGFEDPEICAVVTDSRRIEPGCVFFAIAGERFDGHAYVSSALEKGAAACVVSKRPSGDEMIPGKYYVLVQDTRRALGDLANYYRKMFGVKVVGITGSVGKTTCREMVQAVLSRRFKVHATAGNFNNDIGLPMTIFGLSRDDEVMVLEMGMNHPGEIRRLSNIAQPDIAVITNVGTAHIGNLGSREAIFSAKKEIFAGLAPGGAAVLCGDDDFLPQIADDPRLAGRYRLIYAGTGGGCMYRIEDVRMEVEGGPAAEGQGAETGPSGRPASAGISEEAGAAAPEGADTPKVGGAEGEAASPLRLFTVCSISLTGNPGGGLDAGNAVEADCNAYSGKAVEAVCGADAGDAVEADCNVCSGNTDGVSDSFDSSRGCRVVRARIPSAGLHLAYPAAIAAAVGDLMGMDEREIEAGLSVFRGQRMNCEQYGSVLIFDDSYNASPSSMESSLQALAAVGKALPHMRTVAVLGDMLEQGCFADGLHREVGSAAAREGIGALVTVGELSFSMAEAAKEGGMADVRAFRDLTPAAQAVEELTAPCTAFLFRASHGMALNRLADVSRKKAQR